MISWPSAKARRVFAALKRIGWRHDRTVGSRKIMKRTGGPTTRSRSTILKSWVQSSLRKSQRRPASNPETCDGPPRGPQVPFWEAGLRLTACHRKAAQRITSLCFASIVRRVLLQKRIEKRFGDSKSCPPKTVDCLSEVNQSALCRNIENPQSAGNTEPLAASHYHALAVVHQQKVGAERSGQGDCGCLPFIESCPRLKVELTARRFVYVKPSRGMSDPVPHSRGSVRVRQFGFDGGWQDHVLK